MDFYDLDLNDNILDALDAMKFSECTPIQEHAIPPILEGRDIIGVAQTGTGKTAAYLLPVLSLLDDYNQGFDIGRECPADAINCIIMSPTRELAQQIDQAMQGFAYYTPGLSSVAVYGGNDGIRYEQEKRSLAMGANVIIATPGRLISHLSLGNVDLSRVSFFILDEADRMLDMGFCDDIMTIAKTLPDNRQTIMFSATMPNEIIKLAQNILHDPVQVKLAVSKPAEGIHQSAFVCYEPQKLRILEHIFKQTPPRKVIIFAGSKLKVKDINITLKRRGYNCEAMHSDLEQRERDDVMYRFKTGQVDVLIATDIVSRGIDIDDIQLVVNYDVPHDAEDYVHRIGRTARAGAEGRAVTLVGPDDQPAFKQIERFLEKDVPKEEIPAELGEGPAYTGKASKGERGGRGGKGRGRNGGRSRSEGKRGHGGRKDNKPAKDNKENKKTASEKNESSNNSQISESSVNQDSNTVQEKKNNKSKNRHSKSRKKKQIKEEKITEK